VIGYVCPDATGVVNSTAAMLAGLDENPMMMKTMGKSLESMVTRGLIPATIFDDMARRVVATQLNINHPADQYGDKLTTAKKVVRDPNSGSLIRRIGADSIVLLKNEGNILPIKNPTSIAVFGISATNRIDGPTFPIDIFSWLGDTYPGHLAAGGGSAAAPNPYLITPLEALNLRASNGTGFNILTLTSNNPPVHPAPGGMFGFGVPYSIQSISSGSDYCLVFLNAYSKEGADRRSLTDEEGDQLVKSTAKYCNNTVVVLNTAGARVVDAWIDLPNVKVTYL
jgi:beta-glucosidase